MLYLIGGVPRVGKSNLARLILERNRIGYVDTDWIIHMLMFAAPQLGVKTFTELNESEFRKKAVNFYPYFYQFVKYNQPVIDKYLIEGDSFLPEHARKLKSDFSVRACFLGTSNLTPDILLDNPSKNNWIRKLSPEQLQHLCDWVIDMSEFVKKECLKYEIKYFDLASNYTEELEKAYEFLISSD